MRIDPNAVCASQSAAIHPLALTVSSSNCRLQHGGKPYSRHQQKAFTRRDRVYLATGYNISYAAYKQCGWSSRTGAQAAVAKE